VAWVRLVIAEKMFLKQSLYSDYCAVYATGMALSLAGYPTSKKEALKLFNAKSGWQGASHSDISRAVCHAAGCSELEWCHFSSDQGELLQWLGRQCCSNSNSVLLVTAYCRLRAQNITCGHVFVLVGADERGLLALDPLSRRPRNDTHYNVILSSSDQSDLLAAGGAPWDLCTDQELSFLVLAKSTSNV
jgi:hypothetical protein